MKDIIERMMAVERKAKEILNAAEKDSQRILEDARNAVRKASEEARAEAVEKAQRFIEEEVKRAQEEKAKRLENTGKESQQLKKVPPAKEKIALDCVIENLAGGPVHPS